MRRTGRARAFVWLWTIPTLPVFPAFLRHVVKNRPNEAATFAHAHTREGTDAKTMLHILGHTPLSVIGGGVMGKVFSARPLTGGI